MDTHNEFTNLPAVDPTGESNTPNGATTKDKVAIPRGYEPERADMGPGE